MMMIKLAIIKVAELTARGPITVTVQRTNTNNEGQ